MIPVFWHVVSYNQVDRYLPTKLHGSHLGMHTLRTSDLSYVMFRNSKSKHQMPPGFQCRENSSQWVTWVWQTFKLGLACWMERWECSLDMTLFPTFIFSWRVSKIFVEAFVWLSSVRFLYWTVILKFYFGNGGLYFVQNSFWCLNLVFFFKTVSSQQQVFHLILSSLQGAQLLCLAYF